MIDMLYLVARLLFISGIWNARACNSPERQSQECLELILMLLELADFTKLLRFHEETLRTRMQRLCVGVCVWKFFSI